MRKRIRELVEQSTTYSYGGLGTEIEVFDKEKFAELIVQECINIAQDRANFPGYPPNDVNDIIDEIREHFGVE
jgi:hypothetical protein